MQLLFALFCPVGQYSINKVMPKVEIEYMLPYPIFKAEGSYGVEHAILEAARGNNNKLMNAALENLIDLSQVKDSDGRTVLHLATLNNNSYIFNYLMNNQKKYFLQIDGLNEQESKDQISQWIDCQDTQGNSVAMLAAYVGNMEIIRHIEQLGADFIAKNLKSQTLMHLAAQGNQVLMISYLKEQYQYQLLPSCLDKDDTTPLHQACFNGWYNVTAILLSWGVNVNLQDKNGNTPLHICGLRNQNKIAKKILYRQGDKMITNKKGQTAAQVAQIEGHKALLQTLTTQSAKCQQTCIKLAIKPRRKSKEFCYYFLSLYTITLFISAFCTIPYVEEISVIVLYFSSAIFTFFTYCAASLSDPGHAVNMRGKTKLYGLLQLNDFDDICADCVVAKPFRSKHCEICQRCVMVYDHHCPWIDNCIGANNLLLFLSFVTTLFFFTIMNVWLTCQYIGKNSGVHIFQTWQFNPLIQITLQVFVITVGVGFIVPLVYLIYTQVSNLLLDQTTFERLIVGKVQRGDSMQRKRLMSRHSIKETVTYQDKSFKNCFIMCFKNKNIANYKFQDSIINSME